MQIEFTNITDAKNNIIRASPKTKKLIKQIVYKFYNNSICAGHQGIHRTKNKITLQYVWRNMTKHIKSYVKSCKECQRNKITKHIKQPLAISETPNASFKTIIIDIIGPLPLTEKGNQYGITIICDLSKYLIAVPIANKNAALVSKVLVANCILIYGSVKTILTDQGTEYNKEIIGKICKILKNKKKYPHHIIMKL